MGCWDPTFSRSFNDSELKNVERLLRQLGGRRVIEGIEDMVRWMGKKNHFFFLFWSCTRCWSKGILILFLGRASVQPKVCLFFFFLLRMLRGEISYS